MTFNRLEFAKDFQTDLCSLLGSYLSKGQVMGADPGEVIQVMSHGMGAQLASLMIQCSVPETRTAILLYGIEDFRGGYEAALSQMDKFNALNTKENN